MTCKGERIFRRRGRLQRCHTETETSSSWWHTWRQRQTRPAGDKHRIRLTMQKSGSLRQHCVQSWNFGISRARNVQVERVRERVATAASDCCPTAPDQTARVRDSRASLVSVDGSSMQPSRPSTATLRCASSSARATTTALGSVVPLWQGIAC